MRCRVGRVAAGLGVRGTSFREFYNGDCRARFRVQVLLEADFHRILAFVFDHGAGPLLRAMVMAQRRVSHAENDKEKRGSEDDDGEQLLAIHQNTEG